MAVDLGFLKSCLASRVPDAQDVGCILCKFILDDLEKNGRLTNKHPEPCFDGTPVFPVTGKLKHLQIEGLWTDNLKAIL